MTYLIHRYLSRLLREEAEEEDDAALLPVEPCAPAVKLPLRLSLPGSVIDVSEDELRVEEVEAED
jgi:hypothetical protein